MMATNIDKALYQLPAGMDEDLMEAEPIEIEIEDPEAVSIGIGDLEIDDGNKARKMTSSNANLAEEMDEGALQSLAGDLLGDFQDDIDCPQGLDEDVCRRPRAAGHED
jgi:hypothetical protein